jgi:hypothetical protein
MRSATRIVLELPEALEPGINYLVGQREAPWQVALLCPCGCLEVIHLNLLPPGPPLWRVAQDSDGALTVSPSIWRTKGCRSHFWIRRGRVVWVAGRAGTAALTD